MEQRLIDIGAWLEVNSEAIFDTKFYEHPNEREIDVFYTESVEEVRCHSTLLLTVLSYGSDFNARENCGDLSMSPCRVCKVRNASFLINVVSALPAKDE